MKILDVTGTVKLAMINKKNTGKYLLLLSDVIVYDNGKSTKLDDLWLPFNSKRLLGEFHRFSQTKISLKVHGKLKKNKEGYTINDIIDFIDEENEAYISNKKFVENFILDKHIQDKCQIGDVYYRPNNNSKYLTPIGIIYQVSEIEVKIYMHGICEWFDIKDDLGNENIYRFSNYYEFEKFIDAALNGNGNYYLDFYRNNLEMK